ncbi:MAG: fasciclin domain-containing protein, partial [Balneolaceae bacterium]|nr:fasciclin domain-containing protein [Balneolaceae bacterium]
EGTLSSLTNEQLAEILTFHVITGEIMASDLQASQSVETVQGEELLVTASGGTVTVNGSAVVATADIEASNGVIHIIDSVLLPQAFRDPNIVDTAEELGNFTTLVGALDQTGLKTTVQYTGPFTVFAPTDDAFNALPSGLLGSLSGEQLAEILQYHVISGTVASGDLSAMQAPSTLTGENIFITADGSVTVNGSSSVVTADVTASNGIIHAIDEVLLPNKFLNVVQIASKRYDLTSLVSAVVEADLASTLADPDAEFTIFAPNNEAFEGVDTSGLTQQQLTEILTYHVVGARILSGDLSDGQTATTVNGADLTISIDGGTVSINGDAAIVRTVDLEGTNGVIHIIDGVLMPPSS